MELNDSSKFKKPQPKLRLRPLFASSSNVLQPIVPKQQQHFLSSSEGACSSSMASSNTRPSEKQAIMGPDARVYVRRWVNADRATIERLEEDNNALNENKENLNPKNGKLHSKCTSRQKDCGVSVVREQPRALRKRRFTDTEVSSKKKARTEDRVPGRSTFGDESDLVPQTEDNQWTVEKILANETFYNESGKQMLYYLKWRGWAYNVSSWEVHSPSNNIPRLIKKFNRREKWRKAIADKVPIEWRTNYNRPFLKEGASDSPTIQAFFANHQWEDTMNAELANYVYRQAKIYVENWIDNETIPSNFAFTLKNTFSAEAVRLFKGIEQEFCKCDGTQCGTAKNCCPSIFEQRYCYSADGKRIPITSSTNWIVECTDGCACDISCPNRVVQRGRQIPLCIFRTPNIGWSVRTCESISKFSFVCEYVGEVLSVDEASDSNAPSTYQFEIDQVPEGSPKFVVDSIKQGNETRFINHSCSPNLIVKCVLADRLDPNYLRIAFFASRDIKAGEEIKVDYYAIDDNAKNRKQEICRCQSRSCKGYYYY